MVEKFSQQRDLFESERSFRLLVEGVADYALYMLDPNGIITSWNIGGERIKGYPPEEILGQHFSRFYTETDRANGKPARALGIAREKGRYEEDGWRVRRDGTFFWASVVIDPIYDLPRSRATSPNAATRRSSSTRCRGSSPNPRSSTRSGNSRAGSPTISTIS